MKMRLFIPALLFTYVYAFAQQGGLTYKVKKAEKLPLTGVVNAYEKGVGPDWDVAIKTHRIHDQSAAGKTDKQLLAEQRMQFDKTQAQLKKQSQKNTSVQSTVSKPVMGTNFSGFFANSVPNDNHVAVSNGGKVVSVFNSTMRIFSSTGTLIRTKTLSSFASPLGSFSFISDPRVIYDPTADRFILLFFSGFTSATSKVIVAFSQTNDPDLAWNFYQLSGNYLNDTTWSDYPIVSISDEDLFITFNQLQDGNIDWRTAFKYSIIWQIKKSDGYNGSALTFNHWSDIKHNNVPVWSVCPAQGGVTTSGSETYFLSVRPSALQNDTVFLHTISNSVASGNAQLTTKVLTTNLPYGLAPNAPQRNGQWLSTNDARVLTAIVENDRIQYLQNSINPANFRASLYLGFVDNPSSATPVVTGQLISSDTMDFGYPCIAYMGEGVNDNASMITCSYLSDNGYPGTALFYRDKNDDMAEMLEIKKGVNHMSWMKTYFGDSLERWGDYNGIQRIYNSPKSAWLSGSWTGSGNGTTYGTWVAKVTRTDTTLIGFADNTYQTAEVNVYPNPSAERVTVTFDLDQSKVLQFALYDMKGKLIDVLMHDRVRSGKTVFSFNVSSLPKGTYVLNIISETDKIAQKQIVVQ